MSLSKPIRTDKHKVDLSNWSKMRETFIAVLAFVLLATATTVSAKTTSSDEELTKQAIRLYEQKQPEQAIDLEKQAVKRKPGNWLPHALLSYFLWPKSNSDEAIVEGKLAARLAPRNSLVLINLGIMHEAFGDQKLALKCFSKAKELDPSNWRPWLGLAQSLILTDRGTEAISVLSEMASISSKDFDWYYELSQTDLFAQRPDLAADAASKAIKLATTADQKSKGVFQLFLCSIRNNQIERAIDLKHQVFSDNKPIDAQLYLRAASMLVPALNPHAADEILAAAVANLDKVSDSDTFFRLARIFEDKARYVSFDRTKYSAWLNNEEVAYRQAIKLNHSPAIYHLGLASILSRKGKAKEMTQELAEARSTDAQDQLTGYLLSKMIPVQMAAMAEQPNLVDNPLSPSVQLHLTKAQIAINGLTCSCKRSIVANSFRQIRGLVLTTIPLKIPRTATVLIDQSMIPISDALVQINKRKPLPELSYELISSKPIEGAWEALEIDVDGHKLNLEQFASDFNQLQATLPLAASQ